MKKKIKIIAIIILLLAIATCTYFYFAVESEGVRFGKIYRSTVSGYVIKSMEAEMLLGVDSSTAKADLGNRSTGSNPKSEKTRADEDINPWQFSGSTDWKSKLEEVQGTGYAVVDYKRFYYNGGMVFDTNYRILDVEPVDKSLLKVGDFLESEKIPSGTRGTAQTVGYIVQASRTGLFIKSLEIIYQEGGSGNRFSFATIKDKDLYDFAVKCVKSGAFVRISYADQGILGRLDFTAMTRYRPYKIEVLDFYNTPQE